MINLIKFKRCLSYFPVFLAALCLIVVSGLCSGCYTLNQGVTMLGYLNRAVPLEKTDDKEFIRLVTDIRSFAMDELGLAANKNYTAYVELDRNYLAAVVSASARDEFRRHEWWFPVVGRMPYKGFFNADDARKERAKLENRDLDVWVRRVDAFSTLGWFKDPLYSYMREYSVGRLADLIIHELVHATVFLKNQVQFNEELAEFIGSEGARLYVESRYGIDSDEYHQIFISEKESKNFVTFIQELITDLETLYSRDDIGIEEKLAEKENIINAHKDRFKTIYDTLFSNDNYKGFLELPVNNAYLELFRLYYAEDSYYIDMYKLAGQNLGVLIAAAKTITVKGGNPREQLEQALLIYYNEQGE